MNTTQKRFLLFLGLCIPARSLLTYVAKNVNETYLAYMGYVAVIISAGFFYLYLTDSRKTGVEVFGDKI